MHVLNESVSPLFTVSEPVSNRTPVGLCIIQCLVAVLKSLWVFDDPAGVRRRGWV